MSAKKTTGWTSLACTLTVALAGCGAQEGDGAFGPAAGVEQRQEALTVNSWSYKGSTIGFVENPASPTTRFSGTVTDVEIKSGIYRLGTLAGGVMEWHNPWLPIGDSITPHDNPPPNGLTGLSMGAVQSHPTMSNIILAGTGSHAAFNDAGPAGSGVWRTTNSGVSWSQTLLAAQTGAAVNKIDWSTRTPGTVLVATDKGLYRSTDSGFSWSNPLPSVRITDVIRKPDDSVILAWVATVGMKMSTDGGVSWSDVTLPGGLIPRGQVIVNFANETNTGTAVYAAWSFGNNQLSLAKSTNGGLTWSAIPAPTQGSFGPCPLKTPIALGASPNGQTVIVGCDSLYRSTTGGGSWSEIDTWDNPGRFHVVRFQDASTVLLGSDSGYHYSLNGGVSFFADSNTMPVADLVDFDVRLGSPTVYYGATAGLNFGDQGPGPFASSDGGSTWHAGSPVTRFIGSMIADPMTGSMTAWSGDGAGFYYRTTDGGATWARISSGLNLGVSVFPQIHHDQVPGVYLYAVAGRSDGRVGIFQSTDSGSSWNLYPGPSMPALPQAANSMAVGRYRSGQNSVVYVNCFGQIFVGDPVVSTTSWRNISGAFFGNVNDLKFSTSYRDANVAFAFEGNKLWRTSGSGQTWEFMSATTPLPTTAVISDVIENPLNTAVWFAATNIGVYKTSDGGFNWRLWANGLPGGVPSAVKLQGQVSGSTFQVFGGFNGRGIWQRDASGDDP
ncbi:MAG TPA: hypothetical protein VHL80_16890 [Polyangia bacterium]|nr:hypothetical protein [Polyangia bacterium]